MYTIEYANSFNPVAITSMPANQRDALKLAIETKLTLAPETFGKPLRYARKGQRSLRIGDYRVIFMLRKRTVIVLDINHRSKIYRNR